MTDDRQIRRFREARVRAHEAGQHLREAQHEADAASAELTTAAAALAERLLILNGTSTRRIDLTAFDDVPRSAA